MDDDFEALAEWSKEKHDQRVDNFHNFRLKAILELVAQFPNLEYRQISQYQHRIRNKLTKGFIDFWQTGTMHDSKGKYYGMGFKDKNIRREISILGIAT